MDRFLLCKHVLEWMYYINQGTGVEIDYYQSLEVYSKVQQMRPRYAKDKS